jgi:hypothetical protein
MLHVGLDLSRGRVDVCLVSSEGELVDQFPAAGASFSANAQAARICEAPDSGQAQRSRCVGPPTN